MGAGAKPGELSVRIGQHAERGRKPVQQDFHGAVVPHGPLAALRGTKGIVLALADGIGSSDVSQVASEVAVRALLDDYYCTADAWSVRTSVERVLSATNAWLHARTRQGPLPYDKDKGYVCTLCALVFKATTVHLFHVGDSRIYRVHAYGLEQLTEDHRVQVSETQSYLSRAMGFNPTVDIDHLALPARVGDIYLLATDGVFEHVDAASMLAIVQRSAADLDRAAREIVDEALRRGSDDNLTVQLAVVEALPDGDAAAVQLQLSMLPPPPMLEARMTLDGFRIVRELHASHRSHIHLAVDVETEETVVLKTPSTDLRADPEGLERFLLEEWVARRIHSAHVLKPCPPTRERTALYVAMEFIDGQTLRQWMIDHPKPDFATVRGIVEQAARGLQAFHRLEMLHQDLRPDNLMIDRTGTVKIIDFGATHVAGIAEMSRVSEPGRILGTEQYTAPEYFLGEGGTTASDIYSLAAITYQMLSGRLPYAGAVSRARTPSAQSKLHYDSVLDAQRDTPAWIDGVLKKALHPDPQKRYDLLSEFVYDLSHPRQAFMGKLRQPLAERHPVRFWKGVSALLALVVVLLLFARFGTR
ncbi:MAG: bifunctional protein-serine/threonine kinase/phosphatase [Gammaproteobacteria bacterium]|nr:bifunctional protein-serine/threonine kinase/phosphatase [Gammaproteobacteria bacterium]MBU1444379.1 bifunctional protein-serine/threonine kinase/phosphatase [Gammaproteobacteria bacterium]MBU2285226.1 bifunctional protein-serine/threonine kinase/phosphatase [Gammaproteobacteria bacterium]